VGNHDLEFEEDADVSCRGLEKQFVAEPTLLMVLFQQHARKKFAASVAKYSSLPTQQDIKKK
jgi:hypothetical protein